MPTLTTTIEDISPIITYSSDWLVGTSANDESASLYSASNFMVTSTAGGTASFSFNGTGVTIYGANRPNHGLYQVQLDGSKSPPVNGSNPGLFQTPLFTARGLEQGQHEVVLQNVGSFLDLDFITWESDVGETQGDTLYVNTFHDTHPSFSYEGAWITNPENLGTFSGGSGHATSTPEASFTYTFSGDGVSMYGPVGPNGTSYTVQLDNNDVSTLTTIKAQYTPQVLLYHATNLGVGQHQVKASYGSSSASGQAFAIDYANVYTTIPPASMLGSTGNSLTAASIVGIVLCVVAMLGILATLALFLYQRQKRRERQDFDDKCVINPFNDPQPNSEARTISTWGIWSVRSPFSLTPLRAGTRARRQQPNAFEPQAPRQSLESHEASVGTSNDSQLLAESSSEDAGSLGRILPRAQQAYPTATHYPSEKAARRIRLGGGSASGSSNPTAGSSSSDTVILLPSRSDDSGLEVEPPDYVHATMDGRAR